MNRIESSTVEELVDRATLDEEIRDDLRRLMEAYAAGPVQRIAVVGNAPLTRNPGRAQFIDSADLVLRCNSFALDAPGDPAFAGCVTHVVVVNGMSRVSPWLFDGYSDRLYLKPVPTSIHRGMTAQVPLPSVDLWPDDLGVLNLSNRAIMAELVTLIHNSLPDEDDVVTIPTSGMVAAWLAYRLFEEAEISLTGFSTLLEDKEPSEWSHHWDSGAGPVHVSTRHKVRGEGAVMRDWLDEDRVIHLP